MPAVGSTTTPLIELVVTPWRVRAGAPASNTASQYKASLAQRRRRFPTGLFVFEQFCGKWRVRPRLSHLKSTGARKAALGSPGFL
jgi:hypothetical protein